MFPSVPRFTAMLLAGSFMSDTGGLSAGEKLERHLWSGQINVPDPVACAVDDHGRVFVTQTTRRKAADLDIREHMQWVNDDVALESIDQKREFFRRVLAPGLTPGPRGGLADHNKDGVIDWKDLTVHSEKIWMLEDTDKDGTADKITLFAEGFNTEVTGIAAGIFCYEGWVYVTIAPDLWRLKDTDGDGKADVRESIAHGFGHHIAYAGHDMHSPVMGPDGRIYWSIGDKGVNLVDREGRRHAAPHEGAVLRCEPDGANFEIFARGLRNPQEIDFDEAGRIFTADNDSDRPGEKERLLYVVEGSDSGWRSHYQYMKGYVPWMDEQLTVTARPGQPAYIVPSLADSHDGPAGFRIHPGVALSGAWKGMMFLNQFPSGKMNAMRVEPAGSAFRLVEDRTISEGVMGIGMSWAPAGRLFMADWAGGYALKNKGHIWALDADDVSADEKAAREATAALLRADYAGMVPEGLVRLLAHEDRRPRMKAQFELARRGEFTLLEQTSLNKSLPRPARLHALWGLGQGLRLGKTDHFPQPLLGDKDELIRASLAKILGDTSVLGDQNPSLRQRIVASLVPLLGDPSPSVQTQTALALGKLRAAEAAPDLLLAAPRVHHDPVLRHAFAFALAGCAEDDALLASALSHPDQALTEVVALRRQNSPLIAQLLRPGSGQLAAEAARAIHDNDSIPEAMPALAAVLDTEVTGWDAAVLRRAVNAAFRLGDEKNAARVLAFALNEQAPEALRAEALTLALAWTNPDPLDRVDGRNRGLTGRDPEIIAKAAAPFGARLMELKRSGLKPAALSLITQCGLPVPAASLPPVISDGKTPLPIRVASLRLLSAQHPESEELHATLESLLTSRQPPELRAGALEAALTANAEMALSAAQDFLKNGSVIERQKAWSVLARCVHYPAEADRLILEGMNRLLDGTFPLAEQLDLEEAATARAENPAIGALLEQWRGRQAALVNSAAGYQDCLEGGSRENGRKVALEHLAANCTACHIFEGGSGSAVGPNLSKIAKTLKPAELLEALITPQARVTPGYGITTLTLKSGEVLSGVLLRQEKGRSEISLPDGSKRAIPDADVASRTPALSVMPPMGLILSRREMRDLVSYLESLK